MIKSHVLRHLALLACAFSVGLALTGCPNGGGPTPPPPPTSPPPGDDGGGTDVVVRPNVKALSDTQFNALRRGIEVMKSRDPSDPTSWLYQANIHGTYDTPVQEAWNSCQHGSYFFLSWHRMYLYYFERILRDASGDPSFALPFWDYTDPIERAIPEPFRVPADATNPLFVAERAPGINQGATLRESATRFENAMRFTNFMSPTGSATSFGGQQLQAPAHFSGPPGQIESQPHNIIHVLVGGNSGWMSDPNFAARDPIFWFHHSNIDRLWNVWVSRGRTTTADATWRDTVFVFFDENGTRIEMTGKEVVDSATQLKYRYAPGTGDGPQAQTLGNEDHPAEPYTDDQQTVISEQASSGPLGGEATSTLQLPSVGPESIDEENARYVLVLEGLDFGRPGAYYEVYVGLPEGEDPDPSSPHYVGNVAIFGQGVESGGHSHVGDASLNYEITDAVREAKKRTGFSGDLPVRFVRRGLEPPPGQSFPETVAAEVRYERLKIVRE